MRRSFIKGRKRCPICKSTEIYKRTRRKDCQIKEPHINRNFDLKAYICQNCKYEFDVPIET